MCLGILQVINLLFINYDRGKFDRQNFILDFFSNDWLDLLKLLNYTLIIQSKCI